MNVRRMKKTAFHRRCNSTTTQAHSSLRFGFQSINPDRIHIPETKHAYAVAALGP